MLVSALQDTDARTLLIGLPTGDPRAIWAALERRYRVTGTTLAALITLKGELWRIKQSRSENVFDYADRIRRLVQRIKASGGVVQAEDVNAVFILGLHPTIAQPINTMLTLTDSTETIALHKLIDIAQSEASRTNSSSVRAVDALSASASDGCFLCHKPGHMKVDCPQLVSRTATPADIQAGMCPRPGHKGHKTSQCKQQQAQGNAATVHARVITLG